MKDHQIQHLIDAVRAEKYKTKFKEIFQLQAPTFIKGKPFVLVFFGPSTVGKDTLISPLRELSFVNFTIGTTSRLPRPGENNEDYIWMPPRKEGESQEEFTKKMIKKFHLIEHDLHYGILYGISEDSVHKSAKKGIAVLRVNYSGAKTIKTLFQNIYNVICISIHPENWAELKARITKLRTKPKWRIDEAVRSLEATKSIADYVIFNSFQPGKLKETQKTLISFVKWLYKKSQ